LLHPSILLYFGHGGVVCSREREVVSGNKIVKFNEVALQPNMLTVSFGTVGDSNAGTIQKSLMELARGENKSWLYDPITHYDNILGYVNEKLANDPNLPEDAESQTTIVLAMGKMIDFIGQPFSYQNEIDDEHILRVRRPKPEHTVDKSGLYTLANVAATRSEHFVRIKDFGQSPEHDVSEIKSLFDNAVLPSEDDLNKLDDSDKTLPEWNKEFEEKIKITTADLNDIALKNPGKFYIFYLLACRGHSYSRNLNGMAKATRDASLAEAVATVFEARPSEDERTEQLRMNNPLTHLIKKGGSRKKRSKSRQRKYTKRRSNKV